MTPPSILDRVLGAPLSASRPTGLLTAEDYAAARRQGLLGLGTGLLAASGGGPYRNLNERLAEGIGAGQNAYQSALDRAQAQLAATQGHELGQLRIAGARQDIAASQQDQARKAALQQARDQILASNPPPETSDMEAYSAWAAKVLPHFIRIGDTATVQQLAPLVRDKQPNLQVSNLGDRTVWTDPRTGQIVRTEKNGQGPGTLRVATEMTPVQQERLWNTALSQFANQSNQAGYIKGHDAWTALSQVKARALSGQVGKEDLIQLIDGISRLNNPGAVVRQGTVKITMDKLGSWKDKLQLWLDQGLYGKLTPSLALSIVANAEEIAKEHAKQYTKLRDTIKRRGEKYGLPSEYIEASTPNVWEGAFGDSTQAPPLSSYNFGGQR